MAELTHPGDCPVTLSYGHARGVPGCVAPHYPADDCVPDATDHMEALGWSPPVKGYLDEIPQREGIDGLIDRAEAAEEQLSALLVHHSEHHARCEWPWNITGETPPRVTGGPLPGQRPGAAESSEDRDSSSGSATPRRPDGSAPTVAETLTVALDERARMLGAIGFLIHVRDCDLPIWGDNFCQVCRNAHDRNCRSPKAAEHHEVRWCDGNPYELAIGMCRGVVADADESRTRGLAALIDQVIPSSIGGGDG